MLHRLIRNYLRLGVIVGPLPNNIIDGTIIDAVPVMANYQWIVNQVNANVPPLIPSFTGLTAFTPGISFGGGSTGITYGTQVGAYVKIGAMVFFNVSIVLTNKGSSTGDCNVANLPFPVNAAWATSSAAQCPVLVGNVTFSTGYVSAFLQPGTSALSLVKCVNASSELAITDADCQNTSSIFVAGFYSI